MKLISEGPPSYLGSASLRCTATDTACLGRLPPSTTPRHQTVARKGSLAETTIGLYKTECVRDDSPFRTGPLACLADLEEITSAWVHWYNTARLMHRLSRRPPTEAEAEYHSQSRVHQPAVHTS